MRKDLFINRSITVLCLFTLILLPGCSILDFIKSKMNSSDLPKHVSTASTKKIIDDTSKVLLSIDGKTIITENEFDVYYEQFVSTNPQLQSMIQFMPNAKKEIFNGMANERILIAWGEKNNIHETNDYKKELDQAVRMIKTNLAAKSFEKDVIGTIEVSDKEMRSYYDAHKDPELIVAPGGIKAEGKQFDSKELAQSFFDKVKDDAKGFKAAAGKDVKDFAPINKVSFDIDSAVKDRILAVTAFPKVLMVKASDGKYWVVAALKKEEGQYRSFDEVKEGLKKMIEREKTMKIYTDKISHLKKEYKVIEDISSLEQAGMPAGMMPQDTMQQDQPKKSAGVKAL